MRHIGWGLVLGLLVLAGCGGEAAGGKVRPVEPPDPLEPPPTLPSGEPHEGEAGRRRPPGFPVQDPPAPPLCPLDVPAPVALHELAVVDATTSLRFSACGHLLVQDHGGAAVSLAAPDLVGLEPLALPAGWEGSLSTFAPTGDWLERLPWTTAGSGEVEWTDLGSGERVIRADADRTGFLTAVDRSRSWPWRCGAAGLAIADAAGDRTVTADVRCDRVDQAMGFWPGAPVLLWIDGRDHVLALDPAGDEPPLDTGLVSPATTREESGARSDRCDSFVLSDDGRVLRHAEVWYRRSGDTVEWTGPAEVHLVDLSDGRSLGTHPAEPGGGWLIYAGDRDHRIAWYTSAELLLLGDDLEVRRVRKSCDDFHLRRRGRGVAVCGTPVRVNWIDLYAGTFVELPDAWAGDLEVSSSGRILAGLPASGAANVVRLWDPDRGVRDLDAGAPVAVEWVGDDGTVLVRTRVSPWEARLLTRNGSLVGTVRFAEDPGWLHVQPAGDRLIVAPDRGTTVDWIDLVTGETSRLTGNGTAIVDPAGERIALLEVLADGSRRLRAGAVPR